MCKTAGIPAVLEQMANDVQRVAFPLPNLSTGWAHFSQQRK